MAEQQILFACCIFAKEVTLPRMYIFLVQKQKLLLSINKLIKPKGFQTSFHGILWKNSIYAKIYSTTPCSYIF